jgi:hypothetical protein
VQLLPDLLEVVGRLLERIGLAVEVVERLGAVDLAPKQVVEVEPETVCQLADRCMPLIDQLATVLGDLAVRPRLAVGGLPERPAAPTDAVGGFIDGRGVARLSQAIGRGKPGKACPASTAYES